MKWLIPLIVFMAVATGLTYYLLLVGPAIPDPSQTNLRSEAGSTNQSQSEKSTEVIEGAGSVTTLLQLEDPYECTVTYIPNPIEPEISGTLFTHDGRLRADFIVPGPDLISQVVTSIIVTDDMVWQWTDFGTEIIGSTVVREQASQLLSPVTLETEVQYRCVSWPNVDYTVFEPPSTVMFGDAASADIETGLIYEEGEF